MSLIHPAILYGLGLTSIPIILHFLLRAKPKKLVFPALRLIQIRKRYNVRRMRLRHIWLLLLRIAVIAFLVFALTRPSLPAANYSLSGRETLALLGIICLGVAFYVALIWHWRRQRMPSHTYTYRRTILRGGTGSVVVLLLLLFVGWPYQRRIAAEITAPVQDISDNLPVTAVLLFDTSYSMEYRQESKTRLDIAKGIAKEHLTSLPTGSRVAIGDTSTSTPILFQADMTGAQARIESLEVHALSHSLNDRLRMALNVQDEDRGRTMDSQADIPESERKDRSVREVYIFSDLAESAWSISASKLLHDELQRFPWITAYLIDVGVTEPLNVSVSALKLSKQSLPTGGQLFVEATIASAGIETTERTVELYVQNDAGNRMKQGGQTVTVGTDSAARVQFPISGLTGPINQGEIRLISSDPMTFDDVQFFTVEVQAPPEILLVAPNKADTYNLLDALAPEEWVRQGKARYRCKILKSRDLEDEELTKYSVLCLIDVPSPSDKTWQNLRSYVETGGGLAVFLGSDKFSNATGVDPVSYNSEDAQAFLPGQLIAALKFTPAEFLDVRELSHPVLKKFEDLGGVAELTSAAVRKYWKVEPAAAASVIVPYTKSSSLPALLERPFGDGRTVMLTTGANLKGWNDLARSWQFVALADQMMYYLSHGTESDFNYTAGEDVLIRTARENPIFRYLLRKPEFQQLPGEVPVGVTSFSVGAADQFGHYEVVGADPKSKFRTGFSVNPSDKESDFSRLTDTQMDSLFGEERYSVARDIEGLTRRVTAGRLGREVFPELLMLMIIVFCAEHFVSNKFYTADQSVTHETDR